MSSINNKVIHELESIVGKSRCMSMREDLFCYEYDGSIDKSLPLAVVLPKNKEEVANILKCLYKFNIKVVGRGSGTGLSGGAIAPENSVQIVFSLMDKIIDIDSVNRIAEVEPGVINSNLNIEAQKFGLRYAPDPSSQQACSIGGNIAENAGGPHCLLYGVTSNHVLGIEVVLEQGQTVLLGGKLKESLGYDLRGVFIGSEGTFGLVTKVFLQLIEYPESTHTLLGSFPSIESAGNAVSAIIGKGIVPAALEMIDSLTIKSVEKVLKVGLPKNAGAVLLVEVEGLQEDTQILRKEIEQLLWESGSTEVLSAKDEKERIKLWSGRKKAIGSLGTIAPNYFIVDGVVPRTKIAFLVQEVEKISKLFNLPIANILHAGDGNIHPCILFDEKTPGILEKVLQAGSEILKICVNAGGSLSGEHGIGLEKKEQMPLLFSEKDLNAMKNLRDVFSPSNLFNPDKIFPNSVKGTPFLQNNAVKNAGKDSYI